MFISPYSASPSGSSLAFSAGPRLKPKKSTVFTTKKDIEKKITEEKFDIGELNGLIATAEKKKRGNFISKFLHNGRLEKLEIGAINYLKKTSPGVLDRLVVTTKAAQKQLGIQPQREVLEIPKMDSRQFAPSNSKPIPIPPQKPSMDTPLRRSTSFSALNTSDVPRISVPNSLEKQLLEFKRMEQELEQTKQERRNLHQTQLLSTSPPPSIRNRRHSFDSSASLGTSDLFPHSDNADSFSWLKLKGSSAGNRESFHSDEGLAPSKNSKFLSWDYNKPGVAFTPEGPSSTATKGNLKGKKQSLINFSKPLAKAYPENTSRPSPSGTVANNYERRPLPRIPQPNTLRPYKSLPDFTQMQTRE